MKSPKFWIAFALLSATVYGQGSYHRPAPTNIHFGVSAPTYAPSYFITVGGGDQAPGHGAAFAYWSVSSYVGQQNYATAITEYSISKGQIITCPLAGISHVLAGAGPASFGMVGAAGACSGTSSGASSAAAAQGFVNYHIKGAWNVIVSARKTFTANGSTAVRFTIGVGWGR